MELQHCSMPVLMTVHRYFEIRTVLLYLLLVLDLRIAKMLEACLYQVLGCLGH